MNKLDIADPVTAKTLAFFCDHIATRAARDQMKKIAKHPTGKELCEEYASEWRGFHERLASTIYNSVRRSYQVSEC